MAEMHRHSVPVVGFVLDADLQLRWDVPTNNLHGGIYHQGERKMEKSFQGVDFIYSLGFDGFVKFVVDRSVSPGAVQITEIPGDYEIS